MQGQILTRIFFFSEVRIPSDIKKIQFLFSLWNCAQKDQIQIKLLTDK